LLGGYTGILHDSAHRERIYQIVSRYGDEMCAVTHDDVLALPHNFEPGLLEGAYRSQVIDARNFGRRLDRNFHFAHVGAADAFNHGGEIILNGIANVPNCFLFRFSL
jgi:hypothetical protein